MKRSVIEPKGARDPLDPVEQAAAAEEILAGVRHDMRNRLATLRNAVYYLRRRLAGSDLCAQDPRIAQFLDMMDDEVAAANAALREGGASNPLSGGGTGAPRASAEACVERAAALARVDTPRGAHRYGDRAR